MKKDVEKNIIHTAWAEQLTALSDSILAEMALEHTEEHYRAVIFRWIVMLITNTQDTAYKNMVKVMVEAGMPPAGVAYFISKLEESIYGDALDFAIFSESEKLDTQLGDSGDNSD